MGDNAVASGLQNGGEGKVTHGKANEERGKAHEESGKNKTKKDEEIAKSDTRYNINSLINSPINARNWEEILSVIGPPSKHILTKESYHLVDSVLGAYEYVILHNIYDFIKEASTNRCFHERLLKFITVNKIGALLSQFKQIRLNAILQAITQQSNMYNTALQQLGIVAQSFANAHILTTILPNQFDAPNFAVDIKIASIIATLIGAIVAIGIEIGNLKNDMRTQIAIDEYCITPCSPSCLSFTSASSASKDMSMDMDEVRIWLKRLDQLSKELDNEGKLLKEYADKAIEWLERLVEYDFNKLKELEHKQTKEIKS